MIAIFPKPSKKRRRNSIFSTFCRFGLIACCITNIFTLPMLSYREISWELQSPPLPRPLFNSIWTISSRNCNPTYPTSTIFRSLSSPPLNISSKFTPSTSTTSKGSRVLTKFKSQMVKQGTDFKNRWK